MYDLKQKAQTAVTVCVDMDKFNVQNSLDELKELIKTAGGEVVSEFVQKRKSVDTATCIGRGKLRDIAGFCNQYDVDLVIFNHELTATQIKNVKDAIGVRVVDRTTLILDIFAMHAHSLEGRLQVELAQLQYTLPRLTGLGTQMSRLGGGIGTRGPGETKLETNKRYVRNRINVLKKELAEIKNRRERIRKRRKKNNMYSVAIVGYTNVGKSTLLNALTQAEVLAEDKLFATLDPTTRILKLPDGKSVLITDTVGFISRLPHTLIDAFRSTLEETLDADLILHVMDITSDSLKNDEEVVNKTLNELRCNDKLILKVYNKFDKLDMALQDIDDIDIDANSFFISAKTGFGFDALIRAISKASNTKSKKMNLFLPYDCISFADKIRKYGKIIKEEYNDNGLYIETVVNKTLFKEAKKYEL